MDPLRRAAQRSARWHCIWSGRLRGPRRAASRRGAAMRWMVAVALCTMAGGGVDELAEGAADETIESGSPHALLLHGGEAQAKAAKLSYYGGPVVESAQVVAVLWGPSVDAQVAAHIGDFYQAVTGSSYFSWLGEYDTGKQHIGRGALSGVFAIAPAHKGRGRTDAQIAKRLATQIRKGALPAAGANSVYLVHFPPGVRISMGGSHSCEAGRSRRSHRPFRARRA